MLALAGINRVFSRHRRTTALAGVTLVLGVVALNAHAALPEHHDQPGSPTMCAGALAIATLGALRLCRQRSVSEPWIRVYRQGRSRAAKGHAVDAPRASARAGPAEPAVLRL